MEPIRTCTITSFGQFDEWCKIYVSLQNEQKNVNKTCLSTDNKTQRRKDAENPSIRQRVSRVRRVLADKSANGTLQNVRRAFYSPSLH